MTIDATPLLWPPTFAGAIFDFDGTIADTGSLWHDVDETFLGARGISSVPEDYSRMLTILGFEAGARYTIDTFGLKETVEDVCNEWTRMSRALYRTTIHLRPGAEDYIRALKGRGIPTALATTNEPEVLEDMELVDVPSLFDVRVYGGELGTTKDKPDIYLTAAERLGVAPQDCIVFEDIAPGLRAAREVGFITCAVRSYDPAQLLDDVRDAGELYLEHWCNISLD
jgi:HAD superfamily hydrolase (TIGR01509 family)